MQNARHAYHVARLLGFHMKPSFAVLLTTNDANDASKAIFASTSDKGAKVSYKQPL